MEYSTTENILNIVASPAHGKATLKVDRPNDLSRESTNEITITVTAVDFTIKVYKLCIKLVSNDATLKSLKIANTDVKIEDVMTYTTTDSNITLDVILSDHKAKLVSDTNYNLNIGENKISILIEAEDGTKQEYILNVTREILLSDNVNVDIFVNGEKVKFNNFESETVNITYSVNELDIKYELEDIKSQMSLVYDKKIDVGDRIIKFSVIAENGKEQEYVLNILKESIVERAMNVVIFSAFIGCIIAVVYLVIKKTEREYKKVLSI